MLPNFALVLLGLLVLAAVGYGTARLFGRTPAFVLVASLALATIAGFAASAIALS